MLRGQALTLMLPPTPAGWIVAAVPSLSPSASAATGAVRDGGMRTGALCTGETFNGVSLFLSRGLGALLEWVIGGWRAWGQYRAFTGVAVAPYDELFPGSMDVSLRPAGIPGGRFTIE